VDVVVECIGGSEGPARALVEAAIAAGKHVVTANKALLAVHGAALAQASEARGTALAFEAAVAGGIPAIKALREGLAANRIQRVAGILNGTCNYILTVMREQKREFAEVLTEAQKLGYAEADPSFDIDGIDAAHKLAILAALAFGRPVDFSAVHVEGIREVSALDIALAEELGYRIKLLGIARREDGGISTRVHPCMVPISAPIARVDGVFNAVVAEGDFVGRVMMEGRGAGEGPTASAVVADIADIAKGIRSAPFGLPVADLETATRLPMQRHEGGYYIRLSVHDRPGAAAAIATRMAERQISLESIVQRSRPAKPGEVSPNGVVPVILMTYATSETTIREVLEAVVKDGYIAERPQVIRIERE
jgi:homoserine dehydrogenase